MCQVKEFTLEEIKQMNLFEKMSNITNEIGFINKNLKIAISQTNSYKAVSEVDVIEGIKPLEQKYRIFSYPVSRKLVNNETLTEEKVYKDQPPKQVTIQFLRVEVTYEFVNIDNPSEKLTIVSYGDGIDSGDKAPGKAMTYADKYALMKAYKISTGDDPDQEASKTYTKETPKPKAAPNPNILDQSQLAVLRGIYKNDAKWLSSAIQSYGISLQDLANITKQQAMEIIQDYNLFKGKQDTFNNL